MPSDREPLTRIAIGAPPLGEILARRAQMCHRTVCQMTMPNSAGLSSMLLPLLLAACGSTAPSSDGQEVTPAAGGAPAPSRIEAAPLRVDTAWYEVVATDPGPEVTDATMRQKI